MRDTAYLAVIVIADEDDCSLAQKSRCSTAPTDGDIVNFRCTTEGVECETPATPFDQAIGRREDCHPREGSSVAHAGASATSTS